MESVTSRSFQGLTGATNAPAVAAGGALLAATVAGFAAHAIDETVAVRAERRFVSLSQWLPIDVCLPIEPSSAAFCFGIAEPDVKVPLLSTAGVMTSCCRGSEKLLQGL